MNTLMPIDRDHNFYRQDRHPWNSLVHPDFGSGAIFSENEDIVHHKEYRYVLWRQWDIYKERALFIGLNPSTADEKTDDPTIRRCVNFAKDWGCGSMFMVNLFAYRTTDPKYLLNCENPVGPMNDMWILHLMNDCHLVVAAWGTKGTILNRNKEVLEAANKHHWDLHHLGLTKDGHPKHPLYLKKDTFPILLETNV